MGFKRKGTDGEKGVKLTVKRMWAGAFKRYTTVDDAVAACRRDRTEVAVTMDGNVLMMQIPDSVETFHEYASVATNVVRSAVRSASVVVVVFDEPEVLTAAKREEQADRDARRRKPARYHSPDIPAVPEDDDYGEAELLATRNCHAILEMRPARNRFYDAVGVEVRRRLQQELAAPGAVVVFDGLDPRGAARPIGAPREVRLFGAGVDVDSVVEAVQHAPEGEGDLKLAVIEEAVRRVAARPEAERPAPLRATRTHFAITIDTDSIGIGLLERARRDMDWPDRPPFQSAMLMRERTPKRDRWGDEANASYLVCDYDALYMMVQRDLWGVRLGVVRTMDPVKKRLAVTLLVAGWILAGSDYANIRSLNAAMVTEALPGLLRYSEDDLGPMEAAWRRDVSALQYRVPSALAHLVELCARNYEGADRVHKATLAGLRSYDDVQLRRAAWCCAYWSGWEIREDLHEFGFYLA
tara:strand:- start:1457 stop:2860 length:1404 start_codon:yes stop_codon:yes gene_type:complete